MMILGYSLSEWVRVKAAADSRGMAYPSELLTKLELLERMTGDQLRRIEVLQARIRVLESEPKMLCLGCSAVMLQAEQ